MMFLGTFVGSKTREVPAYIPPESKDKIYLFHFYQICWSAFPKHILCIEICLVWYKDQLFVYVELNETKRIIHRET